MLCGRFESQDMRNRSIVSVSTLQELISWVLTLQTLTFTELISWASNLLSGCYLQHEREL